MIIYNNNIFYYYIYQMSQSIVNIMSDNSKNYKIKHTDFSCNISSEINNVISMELLYCIIPCYFDVIHDMNNKMVIEFVNNSGDNFYIVLEFPTGTPQDFQEFREDLLALVYNTFVQHNEITNYFIVEKKDYDSQYKYNFKFETTEISPYDEIRFRFDLNKIYKDQNNIYTIEPPTSSLYQTINLNTRLCRMFGFEPEMIKLVRSYETNKYVYTRLADFSAQLYGPDSIAVQISPLQTNTQTADTFQTNTIYIPFLGSPSSKTALYFNPNGNSGHLELSGRSKVYNLRITITEGDTLLPLGGSKGVGYPSYFSIRFNSTYENNTILV